MMGTVTVYPGRAEGILPAPPCKDEEHTGLVLAALTQTGTRLESTDEEKVQILDALRKMGAASGLQGKTMEFFSPPKAGRTQIACSKSVFYMLLPLCAALGGEYVFTKGYDCEAAAALDDYGIKCAPIEGGCKVTGRLSAERININDKRLLNGLLAALPLLNDTEVHYSGPGCDVSLALWVLRQFGYRTSERKGYRITEHRYPKEPFVFRAGGDYKKSAYLMLPGFVSGQVGITGLLSGSGQKQKSILDEFRSLKLDVQEYNGAVFANKSRAKADMIDISLSAAPAAMFALCCFGSGRCTLKNTKLLEDEEKKTFEIVLKGMKGIGADITRIGEDIIVSGSNTLLGGRADAKENEDAALVFAAAALRTQTGIKISNAKGIRALSSLGISVL